MPKGCNLSRKRLREMRQELGKKVGKIAQDNQSEYSDHENPFYEEKTDQPTLDTTEEIKDKTV